MQATRLRRLRRDARIRNWVGQTDLYPKNLILPYFVVEGKGVKEPITSMQGVWHLSVDRLLKDIDEARKLGIKSVLLFGIPKTKNESGSEAYKKDGVVQKCIKAIRREFGDMVVITDVCLCGYTPHGHCGVIKKAKIVDNDATLKLLAKIALSHAEAGADFVAPSAMMDGQVKAIRKTLDKHGFEEKGVLCYSAKYASNFYGPFREALGSTPQFGDRKNYQMDYRNSDQALREIKEDIDEGADIVMIKPALAYLDIIAKAKERFNIPIAAYSVSGEYSMVKNYCKTESAEKELISEVLTSIKRAGARFIITYWAKDVARWLKK